MTFTHAAMQCRGPTLPCQVAWHACRWLHSMCGGGSGFFFDNILTSFAGLVDLNHGDFNHWLLFFCQKFIWFKSQQSAYFRLPFIRKIIYHRHTYCLKLFRYSFIQWLLFLHEIALCSEHMKSVLIRVTLLMNSCNCIHAANMTAKFKV